MATYATTAELKAWLDDNPDNVTDAAGNSNDALLARLLEAASRAIDEDTGRAFYAQTAAARTYYPDPGGVLHVVDLVSVTSIVMDANGDDIPETTLEATDYRLLPKTGGPGGVAVARYQEVHAAPGAARRFYPGWPVLITGNWGYTETFNGVVSAPRDIQTACLILASRYYMRRYAKLGRAVIPEAGVSEGLPRTDPDYLAIVNRYMHPLRRMVFA